MNDMKSLWELLWEYDPNGLIAVDESMNVRVVNPAFCRMFGVERDKVLGRPAAEILGDITEFQKAGANSGGPSPFEKEYKSRGLYVRQVIFPIPAEGVTACIMVDLTREWNQRNELLRLRRETVERVNRVVDRQMRVAQEIASLLGESTGETKASLLSLVEIVDKGTA
ncbi:MAG: PAS domain S-box protein [Bryobacteraceae bacterium]